MSKTRIRTQVDFGNGPEEAVVFGITRSPVTGIMQGIVDQGGKRAISVMKTPATAHWQLPSMVTSYAPEAA